MFVYKGSACPIHPVCCINTTVFKMVLFVLFYWAGFYPNWHCYSCSFFILAIGKKKRAVLG